MSRRQKTCWRLVKRVAERLSSVSAEEGLAVASGITVHL